jgi:DNA-binding NarL/FixJ family response regulator
MNPKATVVIAEDHPEMLEAVSRVLLGEVDIVSTVQDGISAVRVVADLRPDVAILDMSMPKMGGLEVAQELKKLKVLTRIVFITIQSDPDYDRVMNVLGASCVLKMRMQTDLIPAITEALNGRMFVSHASS